jgi:hypothetical protein
MKIEQSESTRLSPLDPYVVDLKNLKLPIYEIDPITIYGQFAQDLFVIAMTQGKKNGTYLEIGCGWPSGGGTNTFALEKSFDWSGPSIDSGRDAASDNGAWRSLTEDWAAHRPQANFLQVDAFSLDYSTFPKYFDYLQIDIDPAIQSFSILKKITEHIKFSIITFEHDHYYFTNPQDENWLIREQSREYLKSLGYMMIVPDIGLSEDWWVDPTVISEDVIKTYFQVDTKVKVNHHDQWKKILLK